MVTGTCEAEEGHSCGLSWERAEVALAGFRLPVSGLWDLGWSTRTDKSPCPRGANILVGEN